MTEVGMAFGSVIPPKPQTAKEMAEKKFSTLVICLECHTKMHESFFLEHCLKRHPNLVTRVKIE